MRLSSTGIAAIVSLASLGSLQAWTPISHGQQIASRRVRTPAPRAVAIPLEEGSLESPKSSSPSDSSLAPEDEWIAKLDYERFGKEVAQLGKELLQETGDADVQHLDKIVSWRNIAAAAGLMTLGATPNPLTIIALSTWTYASWAMVAHHTSHGGYNRVDAGKFNSRCFALGTLKRRAADWLDWMKPEAWNVEHNRLHHYRLNELQDPDLVQRNLKFVRQDKSLPMWMKYAKVFLFLPIWKWYYYAPNTFKELQLSKWAAETGKAIPNNIDTTQAFTVRALLNPKTDSERSLLKIVKPADFFGKVVAPFFFLRFVLLPLPFLAFAGPKMFQNAIINLLAAELLTNVHAFVTIVTNHAGEDLYTFEDAVKPKSSAFYVRQIVGSTNYQAGNDAIDFGHGFLNYQVEHHVWPDLSMLQYQRGAPRLKAICEKYEVPYVQESVFERMRKTLRIMTGQATMRQFPVEYEPVGDKAGVAGVAWKKTHGAIDEE